MAADFQAQFRPDVPEEAATELGRIFGSRPITGLIDTWTNQPLVVLWAEPTGNPEHILTISKVDGMRLMTSAMLASGRFKPGSGKANAGHILVPGDHPAFKARRATSPPLKLTQRS